MRYYHGTSVLFDRFDLSHVLEGDGKVKFGYGVYLSPVYKSAAHYSGVNPNATEHYVYTVEIPQMTDTNVIAFKQPIHPTILSKAGEKLGHPIPPKYILDGKDFRKYIAKELTGRADFQGEKAASEFLYNIGVQYICWPYNWKNPNLGMYCVVLNENDIRILRIDQVELDKKEHLIEDSIKLIKQF